MSGAGGAARVTIGSCIHHGLILTGAWFWAYRLWGVFHAMFR